MSCWRLGWEGWSLETSHTHPYPWSTSSWSSRERIANLTANFLNSGFPLSFKQWKNNIEALDIDCVDLDDAYVMINLICEHRILALQISWNNLVLHRIFLVPNRLTYPSLHIFGDMVPTHRHLRRIARLRSEDLLESCSGCSISVGKQIGRTAASLLFDDVKDASIRNCIQLVCNH